LPEERLAIAGREGEDRTRRAAVVEVDVARSSRQDSVGGEPVADVLHGCGLRADDHPPVPLLVEPERRDAVLGAVEAGGLGGGGRARQPGGGATDLPALALDEPLEGRPGAARQRWLAVFVGGGVGRDGGGAACEPFGASAGAPATSFGGERQVLRLGVPPVESSPEATPPGVFWRGHGSAGFFRGRLHRGSF